MLTPILEAWGLRNLWLCRSGTSKDMEYYAGSLAGLQFPGTSETCYRYIQSSFRQCLAVKLQQESL